MGARSIRGDELSDEEMLAPIRFLGRSGLAFMALLTLLVLWCLERMSELLAGSSQAPCETRVREVLDPFWTVALAYVVFAIGAAVFLFLWEVRCRQPHVAPTLRSQLHLNIRLGVCDPFADVRASQKDPLLDRWLSANGGSCTKDRLTEASWLLTLCALRCAVGGGCAAPAERTIRHSG